MGSPGETAIAHWLFTYPYSGNLEDDRVYTRGEDLYYTRTAVDRSSGALTGPSLSNWMRIDNLREVTINRTTTEIDVQVWGIGNTSVLVLHFTKTQMAIARALAHDLERLPYSVYLPMQNRAKMLVSSSSFAASPVS
ncbi:MAG TPA: hypothetical protein VFN37_00990 [Candidatus Baltobacteraceae bacterium]|nr:hypothetical protein [Candidatus Baltobacteraceae bacterium]